MINDVSVSLFGNTVSCLGASLLQLIASDTSMVLPASAATPLRVCASNKRTYCVLHLVYYPSIFLENIHMTEIN